MRSAFTPFCSLFLFYYAKFLWLPLGKHHFKGSNGVCDEFKDFQRIQWLSSTLGGNPSCTKDQINLAWRCLFHVFSNADSICYGYFPRPVYRPQILIATWNGNAKMGSCLSDLTYKYRDGQPFINGQNFLVNGKTRKVLFAYGASHL